MNSKAIWNGLVRPYWNRSMASVLYQFKSDFQISWRVRKLKYVVLGIEKENRFIEAACFSLKVLLSQTLLCLQQQLWFEVDLCSSGFPSSGSQYISLMWYYFFNCLLEQTIKVKHCTMKLHCCRNTRCVVIGKQHLKVSVIPTWNWFSRMNEPGTAWEGAELVRFRACGGKHPLAR